MSRLGEALAPFRQRFLYNNVQYLAAGSAAAAAAGMSWDALMKARILVPLGMTATRTSFRDAWTDPRTARGYMALVSRDCTTPHQHLERIQHLQLVERCVGNL